MSSFLAEYNQLAPVPFVSCWCSPSNIAFVKYWGKKGPQLPANPSVSMALGECRTTTKTTFTPGEQLSVQLNLDGKNEEKFALKIHGFLESLKSDLPLLANLNIQIDTSNTFPHGTGIASSASGLSAFALTLTDYLQHLLPDVNEELFFKRASFISRLASGSACRSVYGGFSAWGESGLESSSDYFATPLEVHPEFMTLQDTVLVVSGKEKTVSSSAGHGRMNEHFFAKGRFAQAKHHFDLCINALKTGEMEEVGRILEAEALSLHAMMLTSPEAYSLFRPNTIAAIEAVWAFRKETKLPLYFTLDAGPNLHLIYPEAHRNKIFTFISHELKPMAETIIDDRIGKGPFRC